MLPATRNFVKTLVENDDSASLSFILMGITILTKALGLFYQILLVNRLGVNSYDKALFDTASVLPDLLSNVLLIGSISAAVIPVLSFVRAHKGDQRYYQTFVDGLKIFLLVFIFFAMIVVLFAPSIMGAILEFTVKNNNPFESPSNFSELVLLVRLLIIPQIILGISAFFIAGLQSLKRFIVPQLTGFTYNLGQIFGVLVLIPLFNMRPLWAIVVGTFLASISHLLIQLPLFKTTQFWTTLRSSIFSLSFLERDESGYIPSFQMIKLAIPRIISSGIEFFMNKYFLLYTLSLGIVSQQRFYYASSLMMIPFSMFVQSYAVISFPAMSKAYADNDTEEFRSVFVRTVNRILFYVVPLTVIFLVMRLAVVRLTFGLYPGTTKFEWADTLGIAYIVFFFSLGLIPDVINSVMSKVFYSAHNTRVPFLTNVLLIILAIFFSSVLSGHFASLQTLNISEAFFKGILLSDINSNFESGVATIGGIALAISLANLAVFLINTFIIHKFYFKLTLDEYWINLLNKFAAGAVMAATMYLVSKVWEFNVETSTVWGLIIATSTSIFIGLVAYLLACIFLRVEEAYYLKSKLKSILSL